MWLKLYLVYICTNLGQNTSKTANTISVFFFCVSDLFYRLSSGGEAASAKGEAAARRSRKSERRAGEEAGPAAG